MIGYRLEMKLTLNIEDVALKAASHLDVKSRDLVNLTYSKHAQEKLSSSKWSRGYTCAGVTRFSAIVVCNLPLAKGHIDDMEVIELLESYDEATLPTELYTDIKLASSMFRMTLVPSIRMLDKKLLIQVDFESAGQESNLLSIAHLESPKCVEQIVHACHAVATAFVYRLEGAWDEQGGEKTALSYGLAKGSLARIVLLELYRQTPTLEKQRAGLRAAQWFCWSLHLVVNQFLECNGLKMLRKRNPVKEYSDEDEVCSEV